jgi:hypothetical protein
MLQGSSIGNWENIRGKYPGKISGASQSAIFGIMENARGVRSRIARTLGYLPGLELALNICPSEGIALAA